MKRRYEVVLDGVDLADEDYERLNDALKATVRDFLIERAGESAYGNLAVIDDPDEAARRSREDIRPETPAMFPVLGIFITKP